MNDIQKLTDHQAAKRIHYLLKRELEKQGEKSPFLQHLKTEHPKTYEGLISECKTHGPTIKGKIREFVADVSKTLPEDRVQGVRKALEVVEERPDLLTKSKLGLWITGAAAAVGIGAYTMNQYIKTDTPPLPKNEDSWAERTQTADQTDGRIL